MAVTIRHIKANTNPDAGLADRHREYTLIRVIYIGFVNFVRQFCDTFCANKNAVEKFTNGIKVGPTALDTT